ncbi:putative leucine-rich repeat receptor-like protein kinase At2g19210 [Curcuma longa]|uniref:putative leucine-rich repeat receptor-like protein kinase At2g19210 n=1 Tax=Curcuma longa TaxID=136217 RepID=UPI003D9F5E3A
MEAKDSSDSSLAVAALAGSKDGLANDEGNLLQWALNSTGLSDSPPILNALEVYTPLTLTNTPTDDQDGTIHGFAAAAIVKIRSDYNMKKNWMGDACVPAKYAWKGLNCNYIAEPTRIVGINLSSSELTGFISPSFASLLVMESLDLSGNNLTGSIPEELGSLLSLRYLNLSRNNLTGEIPVALQQKREEGRLIFEFEGNHYLCTDVTQCEESRKTKKLTMPIIVVLCLVSVLLIFVVIFMVWRLRKSEGNFSRLLKRRRDNPLQLENREFTYSELERITNNFKNIIGKGAFGTVYHGLLEDGTQVAVKLRSQSSSQGTKEFLAEVLHNIAVAEYLRDGFTDPRNLLDALNKLKDDYIQQKKEGKLKLESTKEDTLTKALETGENAGRVRAIGGHITPSVYFQVGRQCKGADVTQDLINEHCVGMEC